jgi:hypothetical protein
MNENPEKGMGRIIKKFTNPFLPAQLMLYQFSTTGGSHENISYDGDGSGNGNERVWAGDIT